MNVQTATLVGSTGREQNEAVGLTGVFGAWAAHAAAGLRLHKDYRLVRHVPLPTGGGSAEADRVIISQYGVFVVETLRMKGQIFGGRDQKAWVRQSGKHKQAFANPLVSATRKAKVVAAMIGLDAAKVFPVLAFAGGARFDSMKPENVTTVGGYVRYIKSKSMQILTKSDVARIEQQLEARIAHARQGHAGDPAQARKACPSCGRDMVLRDAKKGDAVGLRFWVCSDYPSCRSAIKVEPSPAPRQARAASAQTAPRAAVKSAATAPKAGPTHDSSAEFGRPKLH